MMRTPISAEPNAFFKSVDVDISSPVKNDPTQNLGIKSINVNQPTVPEFNPRSLQNIYLFGSFVQLAKLLP